MHKEVGKVLRVHLLHELEVTPAVPRLDGAVHVHMLPAAHRDLGPAPFNCPDAGDLRLLRDRGGIEEEIPLMGPGLLDLAPHAVEKRLLLDGIASRGFGAGAEEHESLAVEHA